jgi:hypothetical protein
MGMHGAQIKSAICTLMLLLSLTMYGQDDDTVQYIHGLPETGEDTSQRIPQEDLAPAHSLVNISVQQIPKDLFKKLNDEPQFEGWQAGIIQLDKNTGLFWIHIKADSVTRSYGFNAEGKPVTVREKDIPIEN